MLERLWQTIVENAQKGLTVNDTQDARCTLDTENNITRVVSSGSGSTHRHGTTTEGGPRWRRAAHCAAQSSGAAVGA